MQRILYGKKKGIKNDSVICIMIEIEKDFNRQNIYLKFLKDKSKSIYTRGSNIICCAVLEQKKTPPCSVFLLYFRVNE